MKIDRKMLMKHTMHRTDDLDIDYEIDLLNRTMIMRVAFIDTLLIERFLSWVAVSEVNIVLESFGKLPLITNLKNFSIEMIVAGKSSYFIQLIDRGFEPLQTTLVMKLKEQV